MSAAQSKSTRKRGTSKPSTAPLVIVASAGLACVTLLLLGALIATYFVPALATFGRTSSDSCRDNLRQLAAAMLAYHDEHGSFPPAYVAGGDGQPMHSWRVLLLPYLDEQARYDAYNFEEPWNSEHNKKLIQQIPSVYACPDDPEAAFGETSYVVVTGTDMLFDKDRSRALKDITDGPANTLLVVEVTDSAIAWTEPRDLDAGRVSWNINRDVDGVGSAHDGGGAHAATADGSVHHFGEFLPADQLRAMATIHGGEAVEAAHWSQ